MNKFCYSETINRTCLEYKKNCNCECDESEGFLVYTYRSPNDPTDILEILWIDDKLKINCEKATLFEYIFNLDNHIKTIEFVGCITSLEKFPKLKSGNVESIKQVAINNEDEKKNLFKRFPNIRNIEICFDFYYEHLKMYSIATKALEKLVLIIKISDLDISKELLEKLPHLQILEIEQRPSKIPCE